MISSHFILKVARLTNKTDSAHSSKKGTSLHSIVKGMVGQKERNVMGDRSVSFRLWPKESVSTLNSWKAAPSLQAPCRRPFLSVLSSPGVSFPFLHILKSSQSKHIHSLTQLSIRSSKSTSTSIHQPTHLHSTNIRRKLIIYQI